MEAIHRQRLLNVARALRESPNPDRFAMYVCGSVSEHFGIDADEANELFSADGCGGAATAIEAAEYIEAFVARKEREASQ